MRDRTHPTQLPSVSRARAFTVATLVSGILLAGCAGSSRDRTTAAVTTARRTARTMASSTTTGGVTSPAPTTPGAGGSGPLAFARCMRADGVPNFPDPNPGRGGLFSLAGINPSSPAFRAAQAKCQKLMGPGPPVPGSSTHPSAQTLAKLVRIARCMRQHGVPQFPDPRTSVPANPAGIQEITDFDGVILLFPTTMNLQAPAYRNALTACGAPPLGLPH